MAPDRVCRVLTLSLDEIYDADTFSGQSSMELGSKFSLLCALRHYNGVYEPWRVLPPDKPAKHENSYQKHVWRWWYGRARQWQRGAEEDDDCIGNNGGKHDIVEEA